MTYEQRKELIQDVIDRLCSPIGKDYERRLRKLNEACKIDTETSKGVRIILMSKAV